MLELLAELLYPMPPEFTSGSCWGLGNTLGGAFLMIMSALHQGEDADPPLNYQLALYLQVALAGAFLLPTLFLGWFGRADKVKYKRHIAQNIIAEGRPQV